MEVQHNILKGKPQKYHFYVFKILNNVPKKKKNNNNQITSVWRLIDLKLIYNYNAQYKSIKINKLRVK